MTANRRANIRYCISIQWLRAWIITILGGKCVKLNKLCSKGPLQIDHIAENGREHRAAYRSCFALYKNMLETGCEGLQLLCTYHNVKKTVLFKMAKQGRNRSLELLEFLIREHIKGTYKEDLDNLLYRLKWLQQEESDYLTCLQQARVTVLIENVKRLKLSE